jgi:hypothetical protein
MDGTTPPGPPDGLGSSRSGTSAGPVRDDLVFPGASDDAWRSGEPADDRSRWVVVAAVVAAVVVVVVAAIAVIGVRVLRGATSSSPTASGATSSVGALDVGACYRLPTDDASSDSVGDVAVVPCTEPHDGQVYAHAPLTFDDYPSDAALTAAAESGCGADDSSLDPSVASSDTMSPSWYAPLEADWADSPHTATCVIESNDPNGLTRSWTTTP